MREHLKPNEHPVNQAAKALLRQANQNPTPAQLYCLQLMQYALETESGLRPKEVHYVEESLIRLLTNDPKKAMRFMIRGGDSDPLAVDALTAGNLRGLSPLEAGQELLQVLSNHLSEVYPSYPPR